MILWGRNRGKCVFVQICKRQETSNSPRRERRRTALDEDDGVNERDERGKKEQGVIEQNRERKRVMTGKKRDQEEVLRGSEG